MAKRDKCKDCIQEDDEGSCKLKFIIDKCPGPLEYKDRRKGDRRMGDRRK